MSICKDCFHSYVCEQFNEHRECDNTKCHFANDHFVPAKDAVEVVRCKDCKYCHQLAPHSEINGTAYFHCALWRGEETKNVWHKYKKYYADYSIVEPNDYCSQGELKEREG